MLIHLNPLTATKNLRDNTSRTACRGTNAVREWRWAVPLCSDPYPVALAWPQTKWDSCFPRRVLQLVHQPIYTKQNLNQAKGFCIVSITAPNSASGESSYSVSSGSSSPSTTSTTSDSDSESGPDITALAPSVWLSTSRSGLCET